MYIFGGGFCLPINCEDSSLVQLPIGKVGIITSILNEKKARNRLFEMGLIPGTKIIVVRVAPLGDPLQVYFRGYSLILRHQEASGIYVLEKSIHQKGCEM